MAIKKKVPMTKRPATICKLEPGRLIDTFDGYVTSWNWIAQSMFNLKGGSNVEIDWQDGEHPIINFAGDGHTKFIGTDESRTNNNGEITFKSAEDSNVVVQCNGKTITIGVYYV